MFKINRIHSIFDCKACDQLLEDPISLPCGETICSKDIESMYISSSDNEQNEINCLFCQAVHVQPSGGFPTDTRVQKMLKLQLDELVFESMFDNCKNVLSELNVKVQSLQVMENDPDYFICEYFGQIINQVDAHRENLKMKIDMYYYDVITNIKQLEAACKINGKSSRIIFFEDDNFYLFLGFKL